MFYTIFKRLREPSTMAGLSMLAVLFGVPPGTVDVVVQGLAGALAVGAIFVPEQHQ